MHKIAKLLSRCWGFILSCLGFIFGQLNWRPPVWLKQITTAGRRGLNYSKQKPFLALAGLLLTTLLGIGSHYAYRNWQNRPKPLTVDFNLAAPARTELENKSPPNPLVISFANSVSPLALVNKTITEGVQLKPALAGEWQWRSDRELSFQPTGDWPAASHFQVQFDQRLVTANTLLSQWETEFDTAAFTVNIEKSEFYQDPLESGLKRAIFQLHFSHPVDSHSLTKSLKLSLHNLNNAASPNTPLTFSVVPDSLKLNASVLSQPLTLPADDQSVDLSLAAGLKSADQAASTPEEQSANVTVPGLYNNLTINELQFTTTPNPQTQQIDQLLLVNTSLPVQEQALAKTIQVWLLPIDNPKVPTHNGPYPWGSEEVSADVLNRSTPLNTEAMPAEQAFTQTLSLQVKADSKRYLFVKVNKPLTSFGGYQLAKPYYATVQVPDPSLQKTLHILGDGSLLSLKGDKKIALLARDIPGIQVELGRVLPDQLQHIISQNKGNFSHPTFSDEFGQDNLSERFTVQIPLTDTTPGKTQYQSVDLNPYLVDKQGQDKRGLFLITTRNYDPNAAKSGEGDAVASDESNPDASSSTETEAESTNVEDKRLIMITDLGIIAKTESDGSQVIFVQSIHSGAPQVGADVQLVAKNGLSLVQGKTDSEGKIRFPALKGLEREREPLFFLVKSANDMSFLPINREDRKLNFSRFDIGGAVNIDDKQQLNAYLFSDRGIYRPGDTLHIGVIVKTEGWGMPLLGLPLEAEILDPRGLTAKRLKLSLAAGGFNELDYQTLATAPTGNYTVNLYTVKDNKPDQQLGSTSVKVEEFQPDRMKATASFSQPTTAGWVHPEQLQLQVAAENLYGAPAEARRVEANIALKPVLPAFKRYQDYIFHDPHYAKTSFEESLTPQQTDSHGKVSFDLDLQKYTRASYQLHAMARVFEAEGGRSVTTDATVLVSDLPYLLGYKTDGSLDFIAKGAQRTVHLLAIDPRLEAYAADKLSLELVERKVLSVLIKQEDGTYRYESRPKENSVRQQAINLPQSGYPIALDTSNPGDYAYLLRNNEGIILSRIEYRVAGQGNVSRSLDRNAELQISLDKTEYMPGDSITLNIRAPYTGSGLITIERDKVYSSTWFKADTQATVKQIQIPKDLTGNAYITVQYSRAPDSDEIFMSPLSYGVAPFKISLAAQCQSLSLKVPDHIKPGETLHMQLSTNEPTRIVVFAVDEGILQVARYSNPDPLGHFFQKKQLAVETSQLLDLILPAYKKLMQAAAPGGDTENDANAAFLNPFKRKQDEPAVFWSGIKTLNGETDITYPVPASFNGTLRVLAIAVNDSKIGTTTGKTQVRGDLILSPNAPLMVAPGDEFSVSVAVANNVLGSGQQAAVNINLSTPPHLRVIGSAQQNLTIAENHEASALFRVKVANGNAVKLGNAGLSFSASLGKTTSQLTSNLSVRSAAPKIASLRFGSFHHKLDVPIIRQLYPDHRKVSAGISPLPLIALPGLTGYLENFEHSCTEQLISKAVPMLVLSKHPELAEATPKPIKTADFDSLLSVLRSRQNAEGGFGLWNAAPEAHEFASTYALHFLTEARAAGISVPEDLYKQGLDYLNTLAASPATDLYGLRTRAYAAYLLTRQGTVTTSMLTTIRETLRNRFQDKAWRNDLVAAYLAASYQLLQQNAVAEELMAMPVQQLGKSQGSYEFVHYDDPIIHDAQIITLLAQHFPKLAKAISPLAFQNIAQTLQNNHFNTLSAAYLLLAYHHYLNIVTPSVASQLMISAIDQSGALQALPLPTNLAPRVAFPTTTQSLHFAGPTDIPLYYAVAETGFDQIQTDKPISEGLEIMRSYLNAAGKIVDQVSLGEEITVQIRIRATRPNSISNIAVQDLLPGGFEPVIQSLNSTETVNNDNNLNFQDRLKSGGTWQPDYIDIREDRVVIYGTAEQSVALYQYKLKASSAGDFIIPPIYAKSLYDISSQAQSSSSRIKVVFPTSQ